MAGGIGEIHRQLDVIAFGPEVELARMIVKDFLGKQKDLAAAHSTDNCQTFGVKSSKHHASLSRNSFGTL